MTLGIENEMKVHPSFKNFPSTIDKLGEDYLLDEMINNQDYSDA